MDTVRLKQDPAPAYRASPTSATLGKAGLALALLLVAVFATATSAMAQSALNFTDSLLGPSSPYLTIDTSKYGYTAAGLTRTQSAAGYTYGNGSYALSDRPMVKTVSGAFLSEDFEFDVDVTAPTTNTDLIYVGFGQGVPNLNYFNEPTESFEFRIHNNAGGYYGIQAAADVGQSSNPFAFDQEIGTFKPGVKTTFQIIRKGSNVTLSVIGQAAAKVTIPLSDVPSLNSTNAHLFFGNTAIGTTFSNVRVIPIVAPDTTPPVISKLTASPSTIWPPNNKMVPVRLDAVATDNVGVTSLKITSVKSSDTEQADRGHEGESNESDNSKHQGESEAASSDDFRITGDLTLKLRAEQGQTYTITVTAMDAAGNSASKTVTVSVPKDQGLYRSPFGATGSGKSSTGKGGKD